MINLRWIFVLGALFTIAQGVEAAKSKKIFISEDRTWKGLSLYIESGIDDPLSIQFFYPLKAENFFFDEKGTRLFSVAKYRAADELSRIDIKDRFDSMSLFIKEFRKKGSAVEELFNDERDFKAIVEKSKKGKTSVYRLRNQNDVVLAELFRNDRDWSLDIYQANETDPQVLISWSCLEIRDHWVSQLKKRAWVGATIGAAMLIPVGGYLFYHHRDWFWDRESSDRLEPDSVATDGGSVRAPVDESDKGFFELLWSRYISR